MTATAPSRAPPRSRAAVPPRARLANQAVERERRSAWWSRTNRSMAASSATVAAPRPRLPAREAVNRNSEKAGMRASRVAPMRNAAQSASRAATPTAVTDTRRKPAMGWVGADSWRKASRAADRSWLSTWKVARVTNP